MRISAPAVLPPFFQQGEGFYVQAVGGLLIVMAAQAFGHENGRNLGLEAHGSRGRGAERDQKHCAKRHPYLVLSWPEAVAEFSISIND